MFPKFHKQDAFYQHDGWHTLPIHDYARPSGPAEHDWHKLADDEETRCRGLGL